MLSECRLIISSPRSYLIPFIVFKVCKMFCYYIIMHRYFSRMYSGQRGGRALEIDPFFRNCVQLFCICNLHFCFVFYQF